MRWFLWFAFSIVLLIEPFPTTPLKHVKRSCSVIVVDQSGGGNFTSIQAAINAVPPLNNRWVCIRIRAGVYNEKLLIPPDKPFVCLLGASKRTTRVVWVASGPIDTSATFVSLADNVIAKSMSFINSYLVAAKDIVPAVAAQIQGDRSAFYRCGFYGVQDTLWDSLGRHYFEQCTIQGAVDFIFGSAKSIYQSCTISVVGGPMYLEGYIGFITAQGHSHPTDESGFVFKDCRITGDGKVYLGRPWRAYATVIFYNTQISDVIVPQGWDTNGINENQLIYDEVGCSGLGSVKTERAKWTNRRSISDLQPLLDISFIDGASWLP